MRPAANVMKLDWSEMSCWSNSIVERLAVAIAGLVPGVIIGSAACVWARSAVGHVVFQQGSRSRDIEFASLRSSASRQHTPFATSNGSWAARLLKQAIWSGSSKTTQIDFARVDEQSTRIPGLEEQLKAGREADRIREQLHAAREAATALIRLDHQIKWAVGPNCSATPKRSCRTSSKCWPARSWSRKARSSQARNRAALLALVNPLKEQLKDFDQHVVNARSEDAKAEFCARI